MAKDRAPTVYAEGLSIRAGQKEISLTHGSNRLGRFICISEITKGKRNAVYIPLEEANFLITGLPTVIERARVAERAEIESSAQ